MSIQILKEVSLKPFNTFKMDVAARVLIQVNDLNEVAASLDYAKYNSDEIFVLGRGSNVLFTKDVDKIVIANCITGMDIIAETDAHVFVRAGGGVCWHDIVMFCIERNFQGIENLALIPGNAGAAPMQNIGAYGVELKDVFEELTAIEISTGSTVVFRSADCNFGYRESVFKNKFKNQFIITSITLRLNKIPSFNISYGAIQHILDEKNIVSLSPSAIAEAVMEIRRSKLPNPEVIGNAGSFFKNPVVSKSKFLALQITYPNISGYPQPNDTMKLAAGWLIENSGPEQGVSWKGYRVGDAGCHAKQALVLVNHGNATGKEIYDLSSRIVQSVRDTFDVQLEREVNIY